MKKSLNKAKKKTIISDGSSIGMGIIPKISVGNTLYSPDVLSLWTLSLFLITSRLTLL